MITLIAKKDLLEFSREGRLYWAGGLVLVLLITALVAGFQQRQQIAAEHTTGQQASYGHWLGQG